MRAKYLIISFILILLNFNLYSQVSSYSFSSTTGTYTPLSTETILWSGSFDDAVSGAITIPSFTFNGVSYTQMYVSTNGFIVLGSTAPTKDNYNPISNTAGYSAAISPFGRDLNQAASGSPKVSYNLNDGGEIVVQWQDVRRYNVSGEQISFQVRLNPSNGDIKFVYGGTISGGSGSSHPQVGLRGSSNTDYHNRTTTTDWTATTKGTTNSATCTFSSTVTPPVGLTFTFFKQNMVFSSATTEQASTSIVAVGATDQPIIRLKVVTSGTDNPFSVTSITFTTDGSTDPADISAAKVYYTTTPTFSTTTQFGSTVNNPSGTFTITGSQTLVDGNNYFWLAYDVSSNATVDNYLDGTCEQFVTSESGGTTRTPDEKNPTGERQIKGPLSGTVQVGTGETFTSLTGAGGLFEAINLVGLGGNLTAEITSDLTEDGTNALNQWSGSYSLSIVPSSGSVKTISGSYSSGGLIRINGADNVSINGNFSGSGNYLSFENTSTSGRVIDIFNNATSVSILNCNIKGGSSSGTSYGIYVYGADNDNLTIQNNNISKAYYGIYVVGTSTGVNNNLTIQSNSIGSDNSSEYVYKYGIYVSYADGANISGNTIFNMSSTTSTPVGMYIYTGVINSTISQNKIYNITYTGTSGYGGWGMYVNTGDSSSNLTIHNNVIYQIGGDGWSSFSNSSMVGIFVDGTTGGLKIYYNSVNLYGTFSRSTATKTAAILFNTSTISDIDLRNNVFVNSMDNTSTTSDANYAIYSSASSSAFTNINYNDYYASGPQGKLGYLGGDKITLADWQTATDQDANSISANPSFAADNDLRPSSGSPVLNAGTPITGISIDYLGDSRDSSPSMGAYENPFIPATPPNCAVLNSPANGATSVSTSPTFTWSDGGGGTNGYKFYLGTDNPPTNIVNGVDLGNVTSYTYSGSLSYETVHYWKVVAYNDSGDASGCEVRSFITVKDPSIVPKFENFDSVSAPNLPLGWTVENTNGDSYTWKTNSSNPKSLPNSMRIQYNSSQAMDDWFFTPGLNLTGGVTYQVSFWYKAESSTYPEKLKVKWGNAANSASMTNGPIWDNNNITNIIYQKATATFTPPANGTYYIGWHGYSDANKFNLYVDDIQIRVNPADSSTATIPAGNTNQHSFGTTGATVQFTTANSNDLNLTVDKIASSPGGALPQGISNLAQQYWTITVNSGTVDGTYNLTLDINGISGVNYPSTLHLLKRANSESPWQDLGTPASINGTLLTWTGLTSFSDFGIGGGGDNSLPVQLASFMAQASGRDVNLHWITSNEVNSSYFEIERKLEKAGEEYKTIGKVIAAGNSNSPKEYTYLDKKLNSGSYTYRLKLVNSDGSSEYLRAISVNVEVPKEFDISQNYPNPFNPSTKIEYQLPVDSKVRIELYNITGELVKVLIDEEKEAGYHEFELNANRLGLSSGVYIYRFIANKPDKSEFTKIKKMMMIK